MSIFHKLNEVIHNDSHLLVIGDHGTGKTSVAHYIYSRSGVDSGPFVTIDLDPQTLNWNGDRGAYEQLFSDALEKAAGGLLLVKNLQKTDINLQSLLLKLLSTQKKDNNFVQIIITTGEKKEQLSSILLPKLADLLLKSYIELPTLQGNKEVILFYARNFL